MERPDEHYSVCDPTDFISIADDLQSFFVFPKSPRSMSREVSVEALRSTSQMDENQQRWGQLGALQPVKCSISDIDWSNDVFYFIFFR